MDTAKSSTKSMIETTTQTNRAFRT